MATTEPLTGVTAQDQSDAALGGTQIGALARNMAGFTVPRFASTAARDTAYSAWVTSGKTMADGLVCIAAGVPYRRINGQWRIDRPRIFERVASIGSFGTINYPGSNETGALGMTGLSAFTVYETSTVLVQGHFRITAGTGTIAGCMVKVDGVQVGYEAGAHGDASTIAFGTVVLAPGSHSVSMRVTAYFAGSTTWTEGRVVISEASGE